MRGTVTTDIYRNIILIEPFYFTSNKHPDKAECSAGMIYLRIKTLFSLYSYQNSPEPKLREYPYRLSRL